jgi:hypothetical protein
LEAMSETHCFARSRQQASDPLGMRISLRSVTGSALNLERAARLASHAPDIKRTFPVVLQ